MGSAAERLIRDAVVAKLHIEAPTSRVVHELVCGGRRADLAAIGRDRITLFEIKSERDTLERCDDQMRTFAACAHAAIIVAHERWFDKPPYQNGSPRFSWPYEKHANVWCFPEASAGQATAAFMYRWEMPRHSLRQPRAWLLLDLLWRDELAAECFRHRISYGPRSTRPHMMEQMAWLMTGREIAEAVCRQLRSRSFPEADPAIDVTSAQPRTSDPAARGS